MSDGDYAPVGKLPERGIVSSIGDAINHFDSLAPRQGYTHLLRGHADINWKIVPSLFRSDVDIVAYESRITRDLISIYPNEFENDETMFDRLVRMQHFGLKTRLMDVSRNPLAALYFAVEDGPEDEKDGAVLTFSVSENRTKYFDSDSVSCMSNLANLSNEEKSIIEDTTARTIAEFHKLQPVDRLFQFIRAEKPEFRPRIKRDSLFHPLYVIPKMNNKRIVAQNGAFIIYGLSRLKGPANTRDLTVSAVRIPSSAKRGIRDSLRKLGYDDSTLFPDIERSAKQIMRNYSNS